MRIETPPPVVPVPDAPPASLIVRRPLLGYPAARLAGPRGFRWFGLGFAICYALRQWLGEFDLATAIVAFAAFILFLLVGTLVWNYLAVVFDAISETITWERWEGTIE